ncbi:MAG: peptide chain release factor N(5)-glutamine methyltransferase [Bacteroidetes bacterium]|nr:peptide chain release factor N(5)-glutamine methyltransferase [Bacteroidota bacterium]
MIRKLTNSKVVFNAIKSRLTLTDPDEIQAIALLLMESYFSLSLADILLEKEIEVIDFSKIISRLNQHEPVQYVLGEAGFYGRKFNVTPAVLIPRPETEILVHEVLKAKQQTPVILDVGTGSGCIAITLSLEIPQSKIIALDISKEALHVANENAKKHSANIEFLQTDFLKDEVNLSPIDILVSNPPYVRELEKKYMQPNVIDYEPHQALFVPDDDPLVFYRAIAEKAKQKLAPQGDIFVEINQQFGSAVKNLFVNYDFNQVTIIKDLDGKDRVIRASRIQK